MKKLLFILPAFFFTLAVNAQTEDEVYIGKGKTFGNYKGTAIIIPDFDRTAKPIAGQRAITGMVVGACKRDCCNNKRTSCSVTMQYGDSLVTVGTRDNGFTLPKEIVGKTITVEGIDLVSMPRKRRTMRNDYQQDIQFAATGIKVID